MPHINNFPRAFAFRLTEADGDHLDAVAAAEGITSGEWARRVVGAELGIAYTRRRIKARVANADVLRRLLAELNYQGNNLNQIAHKMNSQKGLDATASQELEAIRTENQRIRSAILDVLGRTNTP